MSWHRVQKRSDGERYHARRCATARRQGGRFVDSRILILSAAILFLGGGAYIALDRGWDFGGSSEPPYEGYRYEAIGDSITFGLNFSFSIDDLRRPVRTSEEYQGWPELLGKMLTDRTGIKTSVVNEGHPGDRLSRVLDERIPAMLKRRRHADAALLIIGTIDSNAFESTPSGEGCRGSACDGTLKGKLLEAVVELRERGRETVHIAMIPPVWGPDYASLYSDALAAEAERNQRVIEYNRVISREIASVPGVKLGPDFFSCFLSEDLNRFSLFRDHLHPNALGNLVMASLWLDSIVQNSAVSTTDRCPSPVYILESLNSYLHGHKQDLLTEGDAYYVDESFTLTNIPDELRNGIWVLQANAARDNRDMDYLNFVVGDRPVSVYIAYDPAGEPPISKSHSFLPATLSAALTVSDSSVESFAIVQASGVTGAVSIGGNKSAGNPESQMGYVAIVVP